MIQKEREAQTGLQRIMGATEQAIRNATHEKLLGPDEICTEFINCTDEETVKKLF